MADKEALAVARTHARVATTGIPTRYRLVGITFTLSMLLYIDRIAISTAKGPIADRFGLDDRTFGWVLSAFALGYALFQAPAGALADRFGPRVVLAAVVTVWSLFTGLTGLAWGLASLLVFRFVFGLAEAGAFPACARAFYAWLPIEERGLAHGINFSGSRLGAAFALPAVAWLVTSFGWRLSFLGLCLFGLAWAVGWFLWFRDVPEDHPGVSATERARIQAHRATTPSRTTERPPYGRLFRSANMWLAMAQYFASNFTFFFCLSWLFPYLRQRYGLDAVQTGFLAAVPLIGGACGNWVGGSVVDAIYRRGRPRASRFLPATIGFLLAAAGLLASLVFQTPLPAIVALTIAIFGADMTVPPAWAFCNDIGGADAGAVAGTMNMAGNLGSFATGLAFPYLVAATGSTVPFFIVGAGLNLLAAALWLGARPDRLVFEGR